MKTVSTSPDLAQLAHDAIVAHPMEAMPAMALIIMVAIPLWNKAMDYIFG